MCFFFDQGALVRKASFFVKVCMDCNGGPAPGGMRSVESGARECNHRWNSGHARTCPPAQKPLCSCFGCVGTDLFWGRARPRPFAERQFSSCLQPPNRRLVFRPSTGAEVAHIFSRLEHRGRSNLVGLRHAAVDLFEVGLEPADARYFDLSILCDPEDRGNVGQPVSV
jgi:hypothetical protein